MAEILEYHNYKNIEWLKEQVKLGKTQRELAKECKCSQSTIYKYLNFNIVKEKIKIYNINNKEKIKKQQSRNYQNSRKKIFNILGNKCIFCGESNYNFLTLDHINNDGKKDRIKHKGQNWGIILYLKKLKYPKELIKEKFQVLCWNCNCSKSSRLYMNFLYKEQTYEQRDKLKLWKEALNFFGPCKTCGDTNLKHLTISHIHNDGAKRRKSGEKFGKDLLRQFRKLNWPESLKKDYCLECFNCNCSRKFI